VESGIVFQMDKAAPENKIIMGYINECSKNASLYSNSYLYLVAIIKSKLKINRSTYEMLLQSTVSKNVKEQKCEQLKIELI